MISVIILTTLKKKKMKNKSIKIIFVLAFFIILIAVIYLIYKMNFSLDNQINFQIDLINVVTILVNVILAIYISKVLERGNEQERVEKNLIIEDIKTFKKDLSQGVEELFGGKDILFFYATAKLRTIRKNFYCISEIIRKNKYLKEEDILSSIDSKNRDINESFTDTAEISQKMEGEIVIDDGKISLGSPRRENIEEKVNEINSLIFDLVVMINRSKF